MRRSYLLVGGLLAFSLLAYGVHIFWTLIGLLFETGAADLIPTADIHDLLKTNATGGNGREGGSEGPEQLVPKIIHQTYKNSSIPDRWKEPWAQCQEMHPDYVYYLWTDATARDFISTHHPSFLSTFDAYPYSIQRADVIRYFILAHYGGTYLDLDLGCGQSLAPLNTYPLWLHLTAPTGISNDAMGSIPSHPFWTELVLPSLASHALRLPLPYATVMASTGPLFLSQMWKRWIADPRNAGAGRVRVLSEEDFRGEGGWFNSFGGSSWHGGDVKALKWVGAHFLLLLCAVGLAGTLGWLGVSLLWRRKRDWELRRSWWVENGKAAGAGESGSEVGSPGLRRMGGGAAGESRGGSKERGSYMLAERRDV